MRYSTILYPTDGSPAAALAEPHALAVAKATGATLVGLVVVDEDLIFRLGIHRGGGEQAMSKEAHAVLHRLQKVADSEGVPFRSRVMRGVPGQAILSVAKDEQADLVVMGSHGGGALAHLLIGSVAEAVVRQAPVPVLVVPWRSRQAA